jgi:hypothetical protein
MAFQRVPVQIANVLEHPPDVIRTLSNKERGAEWKPPTIEAYIEAVDKCIDSATTFLDHARVFVEAKRAYELLRKEIELGRVREEINALKLVIPLLEEPAVACQTERLSSDSDVSTSRTEPAMAQCAEFEGGRNSASQCQNHTQLGTNVTKGLAE